MADDLSGTVLGDRYKLLRVLGEGGMGTVYLARHLALGAEVAIKMLGDEFADHPGFRRRFHDEARAMARVAHEHIVRVGDIDTTPDGRVYYVMEYLAGEDLACTLEREGRLAWQRVRSIAAQLCEALASAHEQQVVHRDLKPSNCFRTTSGESEDFIKILDFGIAKIVADESPRGRVGDSQGLERVDSRRWRHTVTGEILGTMAYMSPEHFFGDPVDHRTDIYALGVILYELLTGKLPLAPDNVGRFAYDLKFLVPDPPSAAAPDAGIPADVDYVVMRALEKQPHDRFNSMRELASALAEAREDRPVAPLALPGLPAATPASTATQPAEREPTLDGSESWPRRGVDRVWIGAGLGAVIVLGLVLAILAWRSDEPPAPLAATEVPLAEPAPPTPRDDPPTPAIDPPTPALDDPAAPPKTPAEPEAEPEIVLDDEPQTPASSAASPRKKAAANRPELPDCGKVPSADWRQIFEPARPHLQRCRSGVASNVNIVVAVGLAGGELVATPLDKRPGKPRTAALCIAKLLKRHGDVPAKWRACEASPTPHAF
ncbi:MAG: protein kinase [Myxococcales bacterium]|nr:protein kinase [Myxococcales bacterium]